jgi:DNA polymerase I-like protein with 3'-5' exonuclease and polymerase domains
MLTLTQAAERLGWGEPIHIDFETTGLDPTDPAQHPVGIGMANSRGSVYCDTRQWDFHDWSALNKYLKHCGGVLAFNAVFDYAWLAREATTLPPLRGCSLTLFRLLATEGHLGQRWSLEVAETSVLGWANSNKEALEACLTKHSLTKDTMWRLADLEPEAFAYYCATDADASYQLWTELTEQAQQWPVVLQFATEEWVNEIELLVEQQFDGIDINHEGLTEYAGHLQSLIHDCVESLRNHPRVAPHVTKWEADKAAEFFKPTITTKRVRVKKSELPSNPMEVAVAFGLKYEGNVKSPYWYTEVHTERPKNAGRTAPTFSFESDPSLRWLLFDCLYGATIRPDGKANVHVENGDVVEVKLTDGGKLPVGKEVLPALGEIGAALTEYNQLVKRLSYVQSYLEGATRDGKLHLSYRSHGTITGRLSGGRE